ncbi:LysR substrate-binding domain-containing protein [Sulfitobacter pacificus]|uniref:LysR substrate-binding domain-containing protein n=1 Tax=Sulfitobacter pacificus TaxID=1499314 RepID=UPI0024E0C40C|nr:LysR substrate-binding domain-containing protein [Sulfitobacter pacificus]
MNTIQFFEAVARLSRLNLAAEELRVSPSAVSQQIKSLEEAIGVALFRRVKRRLVLTEAGELFYASSTQALGLIRNARSRVSRKQEYRSLVIRVAPSFGVRWLSPRIGGFVEAHPDFDIRVDATSELTDFDKENVDLEVRYGLEPPKGVNATPLITDQVMPFCHPKFAQDAALVGLSVTLGSARLIHTVKAQVTWQEWLERQNIDSVDSSHGLHFDRSSMSIRAAVDRLGVVLETATLAMPELQSGSLVPLAPHLGALCFPTYWLCCPPRHLNRRAVKAFANWIGEEAKEHESRKLRLLGSLGCEQYFDYKTDG